MLEGLISILGDDFSMVVFVDRYLVSYLRYKVLTEKVDIISQVLLNKFARLKLLRYDVFENTRNL